MIETVFASLLSFQVVNCLDVEVLIHVLVFFLLICFLTVLVKFIFDAICLMLRPTPTDSFF